MDNRDYGKRDKHKLPKEDTRRADIAKEMSVGKQCISPLEKIRGIGDERGLVFRVLYIDRFVDVWIGALYGTDISRLNRWVPEVVSN